MAAQALALSDTLDLPDELGARLPLIPRIEWGLGVVPIRERGSVLLQYGEIAVYDEDWLRYNDLIPGLYCIEYQRPVSGMSWGMVSERFLAQDPVRFDIDRLVVRVARSAKLEDRWICHPLSPVDRIGGAPVYRMSDGPFHEYQLVDKLLGPVVGIYAPAPLPEVC